MLIHSQSNYYCEICNTKCIYAKSNNTIKSLLDEIESKLIDTKHYNYKLRKSEWTKIRRKYSFNKSDQLPEETP